MAVTGPRQPAGRPTALAHRPCSSPSRDAAAVRGPWPPMDSLNSLAASPLQRPKSASNLLDRAHGTSFGAPGHRSPRYNPAFLDVLPRDDVFGRPRHDDIAALVDFFRNHAPPPENFMSTPSIHDSERRRARWARIRKIGKRTSYASGGSTGANTPQIRLPDTAVSGTTIGGHRHIAISIPLEAFPMGSVPRSQYPVIAPYDRNGSPDRREPVRTFVNDKGVVTVLRAVTEEFEPPASPAPSGPLPPLPFSHVRRSPAPSTDVSRHSTSDLRTSFETTKGDHRAQLYSSRSDSMLSRQDSSSTNSRRTYQRSVPAALAGYSIYPARASSKQLGPNLQQARSIDGILAQHGGGSQDDSFANPEKRRAETPSDRSDRPISVQRMSSRPTTSNGWSSSSRRASQMDEVDVDEYDDTPLLLRDEDDYAVYRQPSARSRREVVNERKKRDMDAMRNMRNLHPRGVPPNEEPAIMRYLDAAESPIITRAHTPVSVSEKRMATESQTTEVPAGAGQPQLKMCPIMVVINEEPCSPAPEVVDQQPRILKSVAKTASKETIQSDHGSDHKPNKTADPSPQRRHTIDRTSLARRREWNATRDHSRKAREATKRGADALPYEHTKASTKMDLELLRLLEAYRDERFLEMEHTVRRLERNGDIWLRTLVPILESINNTMNTITANNQEKWKPDDSLAGALGQRRASAVGSDRLRSGLNDLLVRKKASTDTLESSSSMGRDSLAARDERSERSSVSATNSQDMEYLRALAPILLRVASQTQRMRADSEMIAN
ncbi:hypothetical protein B0I35DRAFT_145864 [Stachybotrys elegans]|uniref:Uncharacterized protein n=1 Tax=Stachybotrys elegans TaxID=80388 RepID=A0A8K0SDA0_9HYPO|nr:hypothetical protein B0I35DRAFT_145864 [Stachybotrys elegans]